MANPCDVLHSAVLRCSRAAWLWFASDLDSGPSGYPNFGPKRRGQIPFFGRCPCRPNNINTAIMTNAKHPHHAQLKTIVHCRPPVSPLATRTPTSALAPKPTQCFTSRLLRKPRVCDKSPVKRRFWRKRVRVEMVKIIPDARKSYNF